MKNPSRRGIARKRPRGYAEWRPQARTKVLIEQVNEVLDEYALYLPLTVRQVFYRLVATQGFEKSEHSYKRLAEHLVRARRACLIPFTSIRDDGITVYPVSWHRNVEAFHAETARRARDYRRNRQAGQPSVVELWTEAAGMAPQLARVAHDFSVQVYSAGGFGSLTAVRSIVDRAVNQSGVTVLLHVGDYDPSGVAIFDAIAEDVAEFVEADRHIATTRVVAQRVALTAEQVAEYDLPTAPAKPSDSRSRSWSGGTCQVEALPPNVLSRIVRDAIRAHFDQRVYQSVLDHEEQDRAELLGLPSGEDA